MLSTWSFVIPGQPPSINKSYHITEQKGWKKDGTPYTFRTLSKRKAVLDYQAATAMIVRQAKPKGWAPTGFVRVMMSFWVTRPIDADNTIKAIHDSIEAATGYNDRWYLPCVQHMTTGVRPQDARVEITISEV